MKLWIWIIIIVLIILVIGIVSIYAYRKYMVNLSGSYSKNGNNVKSYDENYDPQYFRNLYNQAIDYKFNLQAFRSDFSHKVKGIYILTNISQTDKVYVGQSYNLGLRVPQHFYDSIKGNKRIYNDYNVNKENFDIKIIIWQPSMPDLNQLEAGLIRLLHSDSYYGYNRSIGRNERNKEMVKYKGGIKEYDN